MAFEDTSLMREVEAVLANPQTLASHHWRAELKVRGQRDPIQVLKLLSIDNLRDYTNGFTDELGVVVVIGGGTFAYDVYPKRNDLEMTLFRDPIGEVQDLVDLSRDIESQSFKAVLVDDKSDAMTAQMRHLQSKFTGDITELKFVAFQLIDRTVEQIRMKTMGQAFQNTTAAEALRYLLTLHSKDIDIDESGQVVGVDMYPPHNTEPQKNIVIPHGLAFCDLKSFITQKVAGIYNSGCGFYFQKNTWFVYPLYDLTRFEKDTKTVTFINVPKNKYPGIERTFRKTGNQLIALVTGNVQHYDPTNQRQLVEGNGIRFTDARNVISGFSATTNNRTMLLRANNNNEYLSENRPDGLNNIQLSPNRITSNTFNELSRMASRNGCYVEIVWENSDPGAITPGKPVRFMYCVKDEVFETIGVIQQIHNHTSNSQPGFANARHITNSAILLFLKNTTAWDEEQTTAA